METARRPTSELTALVHERLQERTDHQRSVDEGILCVRFDVDDRDDDRVQVRPETAYSSKPGVGRIITFAKQLVIRAERQVLDDMADQFNAILRAERDARADLEAEVVRLRARLDALNDDAGR